MNDKKHTYVLIGNYGSGKSELAINLAMIGKKELGSAVMVDLDIINPYFRSSDATELLNANGVEVKKPLFAGTGVEGLSLPPDIAAVFINDAKCVVFDAGGDSTGATALGQYKHSFDKLENLETLFVANIRRPMSSTPELLIEMMQTVSYKSRLSITGIINNTNLSDETTVDNLIEGAEVLKEVTRLTGIPVRMTTSTKPIIDKLKEMNVSESEYGELRVIERYMNRDWKRWLDLH